MDDNKGLKVLSDILAWSDDEARTEFAWLRMMAALKYDDYRDFLPGMRFLENLAAWLQQFSDPAERREAYALLRRRLIYVSPPEMQRLVELLYPCFIERRLIQIIAERRKIPRYLVRVDKTARADFETLRRRTLVLGLSDGARIDILRHSTVGNLTNEQFVVQTQTDRFKWKSLLNDLRKAQPGDPNAAFEVVFLVDDFMGTGSSFLRFDTDEKKWTGKLCKFLESLNDAMSTVPVMADGWQLCVHHYLATEKATTEIPTRECDAMAVIGKKLPLNSPSRYTFGARVPGDFCVNADSPSDAALVALTKTYYSTKIQTRHTAIGGVAHLGLGYGGCALPLVLHHNTPNNSLALLWAEAAAGPNDEGIPQPEMRALFRRRQRHT